MVETEIFTVQLKICVKYVNNLKHAKYVKSNWLKSCTFLI